MPVGERGTSALPPLRGRGILLTAMQVRQALRTALHWKQEPNIGSWSRTEPSSPNLTLKFARKQPVI